MNTHHNDLPLNGSISLIYLCSFLVVVLTTITSLGGILFRAAIYPTEELLQSFVPNDVVNMFIGSPILLGSMWLAWRGKLLGLLCWMGALFFVLYNFIAYVFAMPFTWVFLLHLTLVMLSLYTLIGLVAHIDGEAVRQRLAGAVPEKSSGGVLVGLGLLFLVRVIGVVVSALIAGEMLDRTDLAVGIADFSIAPAWIIVGILLWRRMALGYVAGLGVLFQGSMLFIALIIFLLLRPFLTAVPFAPVDVVVVFIIGLICFLPFTLFVRGVLAAQKLQPDRQPPQSQ